ncbi:Pyrroline-5-carboxylate reductase [Golovinomyces cichoracearum]|uniref:Pyrroline-5-carboxylate reductase n=1 Tax=Golovinomyces cichoracearum TaxID=62708 RepID=A0A420IZB9_9PEZI|nr:Pyrroline-5-carboxylate reductase [Golovinomyces cichoracearum]RKF79868.1 Pyrroline-5-carboxylate reductase [Golovinomyces cichoracearum]
MSSPSSRPYNGKKSGIEIPKGLTLSVIGCGTMGSALLGRLMEACERAREKGDDVPFDRFFATVNSEESRFNLLSKFSAHQSYFRAYSGENDLWMDSADVVILAFKPDMVEKILNQKGVRDALAGKLVISVIVGTPQKRLLDAISLSKPSEVVEKGSSLYSDISYAPTDKPPYIKRAMMNIAAEYGQSMTVIETPPSIDVNDGFEKLTRWIFEQCGKISFVGPETFDIAGVLSGASGALLSVALEGILDGAVSQGLVRTQAKEIVTQSLISFATLLENGAHPAVMRENFTIPHGTTISGLMSLEEDRVRWAFSKATIASSERSKDIGGRS